MKKNNLVSIQLLKKQDLISKPFHNEAYKFWQSEWRIAIEEIGLQGLSVDYSDKFLAADEVLVMKKDHDIVALGLINYLDLDLLASKDLSYFNVMTDEAKTFMTNNNYGTIMVSTYNIVGKKYRRMRVKGTVLAIALPGVALKIFHSNPKLELCLGMPLLASANHRTLTRLGMKNLPGGLITIHNVQAQFMYVNKGDVDLGKYDLDVSSLFVSDPVAA